MKKIKKLIFSSLLIAPFSLLYTSSFAQGDISEIIKSGREDATKLTGAYLNPLFKGIGFGMNSGWYHSARAKNLGKFDLKIQATAAIVPSSDQSFDITKIGLSSNTKLRDPNNFMSPTAFGDDKNGPELYLVDNANNELSSFTMPSGTGFPFVPSPQVQLTVGLIKSTDITVRYSPKVGGGDYGKLGSWGVGLKKEITSILPWKSEKIIPIDLAIALGYNQINYDYNIPEDKQINESNSPEDLKQRVEGKFYGFAADLILSKKLAIFTPFVSVGFNTAKTDLGVLGKYIIQNGVDVDDLTPTYESLENPVKIKQTDISGVRANIGFSLHLTAFRLYGAYSVGDYQAVTAGIGIGIGK